MNDQIKISEELQSAFKSIIDEFVTDERPVRERQIRIWKKLALYWDGFQKTWWDETAHDYRTFNSDIQQSVNLNDSSYYDRPINVFQAYLSTIIAALSSSVPPVKCTPDDADNPDDITTAKGGSKIAELIYKHNDASLLWVKALWTYCLQGMIAAYSRTECDDKFGSVDVDNYEDDEQEIARKICPNCGKELVGQELDLATNLALNEEDEFDPSSDDVDIQGLNSEDPESKVTCPQCLMLVDPEIRKDKFVVERFVGKTKQPKSRQLIEILGGLYVFIPNYAKNQEDSPILGYMREEHYSNIYEKYPHLAKENFRSNKLATASGNEAYERWGRLSNQYLGEYPLATPTLGSWWLRPRTYWMIPDDNLRKEAERKFPFGVRLDFVNEVFAAAYAEDLDDHWTIISNPTSNYVHYDPLGLLLTSVQEITSDLISLTLQTIEHGIGQTFADPSVLNFEQYSQTQAMPGAVYPAKAKTGRALNDAFYQISTASLGREVEPFGEKINELGQFVSGALPSLFGGAGSPSQRTASQQALSRNQALQRLQTIWKMINSFWEKIFGKVIPAYIKNMLDDENIVREFHGTFVNDTIKRAQLNGKLGQITVESSDQLPQTWAQIRDIVMQLMASNNPLVLQALADPVNIGTLKEALGLLDFEIPGENDREKQYQEIKLLLQSEPIQQPNQLGPQLGQQQGQQQGQMLPSIMPEFLVDNHKVEADICRDWLVSESGQIAKIENRPGYENVVAHLQIHIQMLQQLNSSIPQSEPGKPESKAGVQPNGGRNFQPGQPATVS